MEIGVVELVLRSAVQRGALDEADVNAMVDKMWCGVAWFREVAEVVPQDEPHEKPSKR